MSAPLVGQEKLTVAIENTIIKTNLVITIVTVKGKVELIESKAMTILSITFCFFDFSDHSVIHGCFSFWEEGNKKGTQG
jgi:hypothetical protein